MEGFVIWDGILSFPGGAGFVIERRERRPSRAIFFVIGLRQAKVVHADPCLTYNYSMIKNRWLYSI